MKAIALCLSLSMLVPLTTTTFGANGPRAKNLHAGAVYVLTNQVSNTVAAFRRNANGRLTPAGEFPTGGAGDPTPQPPDPNTDPLASQGALVISQGKRFLIAVNAGSNQISVLKIMKNELQQVGIVDSGGVRPISLALHDDLLYVLNEGGTPNITGFNFDEDGTLTSLPGSTRPLIGGVAADPAQIGFSHDGTLLVVTEKSGNRINTYTINDDGLPSPPMDNASNGMTPFGFAFNNADTLVVSEAFGGAANQSAASSYSVSDAGALSVISGSVPNSQTASCWVVITNNGKFAFVSNTGSGTISSYRINAEDGSLTLLNPVAANTGMGSAPIDIALSNNSRILFVLVAGTQSVASFRVWSNGNLTPVDTAGGLPPGAQGMAAK
ncbi:MAG: beta-propeller fold lactonase family protein [Verrucomicrobia bacterium]|nr:beta-propeller fold lactonase family protein [Verrucomicrobiota bacterium]